MLSAKRVTAMLALALAVALAGIGTGLLTVRRLADTRRELSRSAGQNRELLEKIDRLGGQLARVRKSFDDTLSQLKSRDSLLAR
ncbi:MAG: hypothetical protein LBD30_05970, partial [Verrucomicrobiales bacterium]|nr:hypothetical protein [Verrucomicrobiales bacterium]